MREVPLVSPPKGYTVQADLPGQRGPQVSFEELNLPAAAEMEVLGSRAPRPNVTRSDF
jgi:hypothetical protein